MATYLVGREKKEKKGDTKLDKEKIGFFIWRLVRFIGFFFIYALFLTWFLF